MPKRKSAPAYSLRKLAGSGPSLNRSRRRGPYKKRANPPPGTPDQQPQKRGLFDGLVEPMPGHGN